MFMLSVRGIVSGIILVIMFFWIFGVIFFRIYIIPKIEKKLGQKLKCDTKIYKISVGANAFGKASEFWYIAMKYFYFKIKKQTTPPKGKYFERLFSYYTLDAMGYKIEEATRFEIFVSLVLCICPILFLIYVGLLYFKII